MRTTGQTSHSHDPQRGEIRSRASSGDVPRARVEFPGALHHITAKSPSRRLLFHDAEDRQRYLQLLAREIREREWRLLTYCQLSNHLHLLLQTPDPDLGPGFKRLHQDFAQYVNNRRSEQGHIFGSRFYSGVVSTERHAVGCLRYIARNPVAAGMCSHPSDWPWSAHAALAGLIQPPSFLDVRTTYEYFGSTATEARANYVRAVHTSNNALLADLACPDSAEWLIAAHDDFSVPVDEIARFLRVTPSTAYRRLAAARANERSDLPFAASAEG
jgi:REP element-mobilizing transposase RayT